MSAANLKLSYKLTRDDYWSAQAGVLQPGAWRLVTIALALWMFSAVAGSFYFLQSPPAWTVLEIVYVALYALMGTSLCLASVMRLLGRFRLNRALARAEGGPLAPTTIEVAADGITWDDGGIETRIAWSAIERVDVTERLVLFYSSPVQAIMIPRRVLGSDEAMLGFVASARQNIEEAGRRTR